MGNVVVKGKVFKNKHGWVASVTVDFSDNSRKVKDSPRHASRLLAEASLRAMLKEAKSTLPVSFKSDLT